MKSLTVFLNDFFKNQGHYVFVSLLVAKIGGFLGSIFIIRILPESDFGMVSIVASVFFICSSFSGAGSQQILLRFGSVTQDFSEKKALSKYLLKKGFYYQVILSGIFLLISIFYINKYQDIFYIFLFFTFRLIGYYFLLHIQTELRIFGNNREFARVSNFINIFGLIILLVFSYCFSLIGYLVAMAFTPFIALFWFRKAHYISIYKEFSFKKNELWHYGLHAAGTGLLSDALFSADILLLSFLMNETAVANYKVAILIPTNITFLAATFLQSDYPILAKNCRNKNFLKNYLFNYYKIFVPTSILIFLVGFIFKSEILALFFSEKYADNQLVFILFLGAFCLNILLRNVYGNMLSAVGLIKYNTYFSALNLLLLLLFAFIFVSKFGILGMAISLSLSMIISGILLLITFYLYWKVLK
jgi:O-antigen/teichoic acid export membrane protein